MYVCMYVCKKLFKDTIHRTQVLILITNLDIHFKGINGLRDFRVKRKDRKVVPKFCLTVFKDFFPGTPFLVLEELYQYYCFKDYN